jgi:hypothetical protein
LQYGIVCLKRVNYDRIELDRRREEGNDDIKGASLLLISLEYFPFETSLYMLKKVDTGFSS